MYIYTKCIQYSMTTQIMTAEHEDGELNFSKNGYTFFYNTLQGLLDIEEKLSNIPNPTHSLAIAILIGRATVEVQTLQDKMGGWD